MMVRGRKATFKNSGSNKSPVKVKLTKKELKDQENKQRDEEKEIEKNFNENLIAAINSRSFIYDRSDPNHDRKRLINKAWDEISEEVGRDVTSCHTRWRSLKDTFNKKYDEWKCHPSGEGREESHRPTWLWFNSLLFLKVCNHPEKTINNLRMTDDTQVETVAFEEDHGFEKVQSILVTPTIADSLQKVTKRRKPQGEDEVMGKLVKLIDQSTSEEQRKSSAFLQYVETEMNEFSGEDEEEFIDSCIDKLRELKRRRRQRR